jgi:predicted component of type VI protein secretion system
MIKRLLRWICRQEIADACAEMAMQAVTAESMREMREKLAHLRGMTEGSQAAFDAVEKAILERTGGLQDLVNMEDVRRAKKGLVH